MENNNVVNEEQANLVIIDADSIVYIVGYELQDLRLEPLGLIKLDSFIKDILIGNYAKKYLGFFGGKGGHNYRKDIAITKVYKGNRSTDKEEWYEFWEPILKKRMEEHWHFQPCFNIEADDACCIAAEVHRGKFKKITIASPDKDLYQIKDMWFYDYYKKSTLYCSADVAIGKLCKQAITGDSTDNIPGLIGAGPKTADEVVLEQIAKPALALEEALKVVKKFYIQWHTVTLRDKAIAKQKDEFIRQFKKDNNLSRITKLGRSDALVNFVPDYSGLLDKAGAVRLYKEQIQLVQLLSTEAQGKAHGFTLGPIITDIFVDWDAVDVFNDDMELVPEEEDFSYIQDDLLGGDI